VKRTERASRVTDEDLKTGLLAEVTEASVTRPEASTCTTTVAEPSISFSSASAGYASPGSNLAKGLGSVSAHFGGGGGGGGGGPGGGGGGGGSGW